MHDKTKSPSDSHRFGGTVAGDDGDEARVMCVLQKHRTGVTTTQTNVHAPRCHLRPHRTEEFFDAKPPRTLRMRRMAATPEVAITLALLGTRLRRIGMVASAAWSKRLPSTEDRWLQSRAEHGISPSTRLRFFFFLYRRHGPSVSRLTPE